MIHGVHFSRKLPTTPSKKMNSLLVFVCLMGVAFAFPQYGGSHGGEEHYDHYAPPKYQFEYAVHDPHTGDIKEQKESREGDNVKGYYSLKEADGTTREVHYSSDKHNGFNAEVKKIGHAIHDAPSYHKSY